MTSEEKLKAAMLEAAQILIENGLGDWTMKLSKRRTTLADCNIRRKTIRFSKYFVTVADKDQFIGVAYHEVAHALLPAGVHHGPEFVQKCKEISPNSDYARRSAEVPIHKFNTVCPECDTRGGCNKKRKGICRPCSNKGKKIPVRYSDNVLLVKAW